MSNTTLFEQVNEFAEAHGFHYIAVSRFNRQTFEYEYSRILWPINTPRQAYMFNYKPKTIADLKELIAKKARNEASESNFSTYHTWFIKSFLLCVYDYDKHVLWHTYVKSESGGCQFNPLKMTDETYEMEYYATDSNNYAVVLTSTSKPENTFITFVLYEGSDNTIKYLSEFFAGNKKHFIQCSTRFKNGKITVINSLNNHVLCELH